MSKNAKGHVGRQDTHGESLERIFFSDSELDMVMRLVLDAKEKARQAAAGPGGGQ